MEGNLKSLAWDCSVWDFPGSPVVKNMPSNVWDMSLIPGWGTKIQHSQIKKLIFLKIAMSMGDLKKGIMKVLEFRGKVWLDLEFGQSSAHRLLLLFKL